MGLESPFQDLPGDPSAPGMDRVLSFSNGIASVGRTAAAADAEEEEQSRSSAEDEASFTFHGVDAEVWHNNRKADDYIQRRLAAAADPKQSACRIDLTDDEDFEREFGIDSRAVDSSYKKTEIHSADEDDSDSSSLLLKTAARTIFYVLVWYVFSTCLTLYNKLLLGKKYGKFPAPLMMNTIHFAMQAVVSKLLLRFCCPSLSPSVSMSWKDYFVRVVPAGVATALDVDLTNASLVFITVTFATMCKSATPVFLLFFAFIFKLETPSFKLFGIIFTISCGVLLTVAKESHFIFLGFVLVILAAISSGFRWVVTQLLLQKEEYGLNNPLAAMSYLTPVMAVVTAIFSLILEPWPTLAKTEYFNTGAHFLESCLLMLLGGSLAFFMVTAEYLLISRTSAVTMTVAGVVKEVVTVVVAILYFGDEFTVLKGVGFFVIVVGVGLFNWLKYQTIVEGKDDRKQEQGIEISGRTAKYTILEEEDA